MPPQVQSVGRTPLKNLIMDFNEVPWAREYKYLLVFICTFPTETEIAREMARCLLKEIIP
jgi:hypothetical protein